MGVRPFGKAYFDEGRQAHEMYGVDIEQGAIVVFRPDGWIATVARLDGLEGVEGYFRKFLVVQSRE